MNEITSHQEKYIQDTEITSTTSLDELIEFLAYSDGVVQYNAFNKLKRRCDFAKNLTEMLTPDERVLYQAVGVLGSDDIQEKEKVRIKKALLKVRNFNQGFKEEFDHTSLEAQAKLIKQSQRIRESEEVFLRKVAEESMGRDTRHLPLVPLRTMFKYMYLSEECKRKIEGMYQKALDVIAQLRKALTDTCWYAMPAELAPDESPEDVQLEVPKRVQDIEALRRLNILVLLTHIDITPRGRIAVVDTLKRLLDTPFSGYKDIRIFIEVLLDKISPQHDLKELIHKNDGSIDLKQYVEEVRKSLTSRTVLD